MKVSRALIRSRPTRALWCDCIMAWCACIMPMGLLAGGCVHFQTGVSDPLPAEERIVVGTRGQLRVIDKNPSGARETVLLVHGYGSSSASYAPVMDALAKHLRVLAIDLPGFGKSDRREGDYSPDALADVLADVLTQKGVQRAHVVGHSWGSSVVLAFARRHPDRLDKLVIISGWIYDEQLLPIMRWARVPGLGEALYGTFYANAIGERLYLNFVDPNLVTQKVVDEVEKQMALDGAVAAALAAARGMHRFAETEGEYRTIKNPTLLCTFYANAIGERLYLNFVDPNLVTQKVVDEVEKQMALDGAVAAALAAARGMHRFAETEGEYRTIKNPTLLLWGRDDRVARLAFGERLARELPHAELVVLPRCGHIPMWECTGETAAALTDFLTAGSARTLSSAK
jgi:pimeloyl-ACP methyl ester carboxylesterase